MNYENLSHAELLGILGKLEDGRLESLARREDMDVFLQRLLLQQYELQVQLQQSSTAQTRLQDERDWYAALFNDMPVGLITFDEQGLIRDVNSKGMAALGVQKIPLGVSLVVILELGQDTEFHGYLKRCNQAEASVPEVLELRRNDGRLLRLTLGRCNLGGRSAWGCIELVD